MSQHYIKSYNVVDLVEGLQRHVKSTDCLDVDFGLFSKGLHSFRYESDGNERIFYPFSTHVCQEFLESSNLFLSVDGIIFNFNAADASLGKITNKRRQYGYSSIFALKDRLICAKDYSIYSVVSDLLKQKNIMNYVKNDLDFSLLCRLTSVDSNPDGSIQKYIKPVLVIPGMDPCDKNVSDWERSLIYHKTQKKGIF